MKIWRVRHSLRWAGSIKKDPPIGIAFSIPPKKEVDVMMTTALDDSKSVMNALYQGGVAEYLVKPIITNNVEAAMKK